MWRKEKPYSLLVGTQAGATAMEAYVEILHKTGSRTIMLSSYSTLGSTDITTPKK